MINPYAIAGSVLVFGLYSAGLIHWGGEMRANKLKAEAAPAAIEAKVKDDAAQKDNATATDEALRRDLAKIRRQLEAAYVATGLECDEPGSGDSVHEAYDLFFGEGLPAGDGGDGGLAAPE